MVLERLERFRLFFFFFSSSFRFFFSPFLYSFFLYCNALLDPLCYIFPFYFISSTSFALTSTTTIKPSSTNATSSHHSSAFSTFPRTLTVSELSIHRLCKIILSSLGRGVRCDAGRRRVKCFKCVYAFQGEKAFLSKVCTLLSFCFEYFLLYLNPGFFFFSSFLLILV